MINNVTLVGRVTRDPELRYTPQNQAVATFSLAVNRQFKNANGDREADFINCVIWRQQAENLVNWAKKAHLLALQGAFKLATMKINKDSVFMLPKLSQIIFKC